jgi:hypothetical protein
MQWLSASRPVAAVSIGGRPSVSSGSQIARLGMRCGDSTPSLRPSSSVSSAARPTSAPGARRRRHRDHRRGPRGDPVEPAIDHRIAFERPLMRREQRHALRQVDRRAAAERHEPVAAPGAIDRQRRVDRAFGRVGGRSVIDRRTGGKLLQHAPASPAATTPLSEISSGRFMPSSATASRSVAMTPAPNSMPVT